MVKAIELRRAGNGYSYFKHGEAYIVGVFHTVTDALAYLEPDSPREALSYVALASGVHAPSNVDLNAWRDARAAMHAAIRDADNGRWGW